MSQSLSTVRLVNQRIRYIKFSATSISPKIERQQLNGNSPFSETTYYLFNRFLGNN